jgi:hypothetical protein
MPNSGPLRLGELLTRAGLLEHQALDAALSRQAARRVRLGELLVEMGLVERDELPALLELQASLREGGAALGEQALAERLRIGRLLVEAGVVDQATLEDALGRSRSTGRKLGETLVELGAIPSAVLQRFLERQRRLTAVALAGVALAGAVNAPAAAGDRAQVQLHATVQARALIDSQRLPRQVVVSEEDVARGYVDLDQPVELGIRSNHPGGVRLDFNLNSQQLEAIDVRASEGAEARGGSVLVPQAERGLRAHRVSLKLRLKLAPGAAPGTIAFPLTVSLAPA